MQNIETEFADAHRDNRRKLEQWIAARHAGDTAAENSAREAVAQAQKVIDAVRKDARLAVDPRDKKNDMDYIFITFIMDHFPHGVIGLLIASFFAAALSAKAAELNALGSSTMVDFYRHLMKPSATDAHYLSASRWFTVMWGMISIAFALCLTLAENLVQAVNIVGALFYPVMLSLFVVGFFMRRIGGIAVFWSALVAQALVLVLFFTVPDKRLSYLWYNPIGLATCILLSLAIQGVLGPGAQSGDVVGNSPVSAAKEGSK
jgi:Na+/proline symporter